MHKFNKNPISIDENLNNVGKGLHKEQRLFFENERAKLKNAFLNYDSHSTTDPVSLGNLHPIWAENIADTAIQKSAKKVKERYFLYFSGNRINKNGFEKNLYQ